MKFDLRNFLIWLASTILIGMLFGYLISCSAQYHLDKYQSKGGKCGKIDTVTVVDSFPIIYRDTIIWRYYTRDSLIMVNDRIVPKTIREIRYDYKLKRDTLRFKEKEIRYQWKEKRNDDRKIWIWVAMGSMALAALYMIKRW